MPVQLLPQDKHIPKCGGKVAVAFGPLLYCLEGIQNPDNAGELILTAGKLKVVNGDDLFEGLPIIEGIATSGDILTFTPYFLWGNRGNTPMTVFATKQV